MPMSRRVFISLDSTRHHGRMVSELSWNLKGFATFAKGALALRTAGEAKLNAGSRAQDFYH